MEIVVEAVVVAMVVVVEPVFVVVEPVFVVVEPVFVVVVPVVVVVVVAMVVEGIVKGLLSMMLLPLWLAPASIQPEARMVHTAAMVFRNTFLVGCGMKIVRVVVILRDEAESSSIWTVRNPVMMMKKKRMVNHRCKVHVKKLVGCDHMKIE